MPMGFETGQSHDCQSTELGIQAILGRAEEAFHTALKLFGDRANVEDVRNARLSLALLLALKTSLQQGSKSITVAAADILGEPRRSRRGGSFLHPKRPVGRSRCRESS